MTPNLLDWLIIEATICAKNLCEGAIVSMWNQVNMLILIALSFQFFLHLLYSKSKQIQSHFVLILSYDLLYKNIINKGQDATVSELLAFFNDVREISSKVRVTLPFRKWHCCHTCKLIEMMVNPSHITS